MSKLKQQLIKIITSPVEAVGFKLMGIEFIRGREVILRVYIDSIGDNKNITIDDCVDVSCQVSAVLDVEDPIPFTYILEISSPGLNRPLFTVMQYRQFIGSTISLLLRTSFQNQRRWEGVLKAVNDSMIILTVYGKDYAFTFSNIKKANQVAHF